MKEGHTSLEGHDAPPQQTLFQACAFLNNLHEPHIIQNQEHSCILYSTNSNMSFC